jgi:diacylglycerol kinase family enzyme
LGGDLVVVPVALDHDVTAATRCALETFEPRAVIAVGGDPMIAAVAAALVEVDGRPLDMRASSVVVANSGAVGLGALRWASEIAVDDGCVDVVVIRSSTILDYVTLVASWALGRSRPRQSIRVRATGRVAIKCSRTVPVSHDGARARSNALAMTVVPGGLRLLARRGNELGAAPVAERAPVPVPQGLLRAQAS